MATTAATGPKRHRGGGAAWRSLRLLRPYFVRHRRRVAAGFTALALVDFMQLWIPRVIKYAIDSLQAGTATAQRLLFYGAVIVGLALGVAVFRFTWRWLILGFSRILERDIRNEMVAHLLTLDRAFFARRPPGEIMALASNDLASVQLACGMGMVACADAVLMTLAALAFMAALNPTLTLIAISPMPLLAILTRSLTHRLHRRFHKVQQQFSNLTEFARNTLSSIRLVKAYTQERYQLHRFERLGESYIRSNIRLAKVQGVLFPFSGLIANLSLLLILFFGGRLVLRQVITIGDFTAFVVYLFMLTWPMMALGWVADLFQRGTTSLHRIEELFRDRPLLKDPASPLTLPSPRGAVSLRGLTFSYPGSTHPALEDVSLDISPGRIIGVAGRTGSGKSTLCHLLARLYPVQDGMLFVDGHDVNRLSLRSVRDAIALVPQEAALFSESIAVNISLGRPGASMNEIEAAAKMAAIHDEIMAMPAGYQSRIGEKGVKLSGGQRQRIALARALILDRPILIIDGGFSAVDSETEHAIIASLAHHLESRTCIIVSHRIAPLLRADEIIVLDEGRVTARGTHRQLLQSSPYYGTIYRHQSGGRKCPD